MDKGFIDKVYELAPDYTVKFEVSHTMTRLQITSTKKPSLTKTAVFRLSELPEGTNLDEHCKNKLDELVQAIQAEE